MHRSTSLRLFLLGAALLVLATPARAQRVGNCELGSADSFLDVNNVRARLFNNGGLFWRGSGFVYTVPAEGQANSIFASGIWIGGEVSGQLRFAGTTYGPFEYWPGPLDESGNPPANCATYDRIYNITSEELRVYNETGQATPNILDWPAELGAPVVDGDGNPDNYNLEGGDRPEVIGDQTAWWVMNDVGNAKGWSQTPPIGMEVQVTAFAFRSADALNNTTFYKYKLVYKGSQPLRNTWFGIFVDPDIGDASDDLVGSDTTLGLGFAYNGDNNDAGFDGYGDRPPAVGYDFFQGPRVDEDGIDNDGDGLVDEGADGIDNDEDGEVDEPDEYERLRMEKFVYWLNAGGLPYGSPDGATGDGYRYLRGIWRDGTPMTLGGVGHGGSTPVDYMFPGDPVRREFWSEENTDGAGSRNTPSDRRFMQSTGPFTMMPGDEQEIVFGIVWAQSSSRLASIAQLRRDDILAQGAFNNDFELPAAPDAPRVEAEVLDETVTLTWGYPETSNNYLNSYEVRSPFLEDENPPDENVTYTFEGYRVFQYNSPQDQDGEVIATFDVPNNVTTIIDEGIDLDAGAVITEVVAAGTDRGVQNFIVIDGLTNYKEYYFGVQAYAYNPNSIPKIYASPINRVTVVPTRTDARASGTSFLAATEGEIASERIAGVGDPFGIFARVANPQAVTGSEYRVSVYDLVDVAGDTIIAGEDTLRAIISEGDTLETALTYNLINTTTNAEAVNGLTFFERTGRLAPFDEDVITVDGLSFTVGGPPPDFNNFLAVANAAGPIEPPTGGAADFGGFPVPERPGEGQQVGEGVWFIHTGGDYSSYEAFVDRTTRGGSNFPNIVPYDFEMRFTGTSIAAKEGVFGQEGSDVEVPFELWNTGISTPEDPSDDYRMIPIILDVQGEEGIYDIAGDSPISSADNDPYSDWIYWYNPLDTSPGEAGYLAYENGGNADHDLIGEEVLARTVLVNWNGGSEPPYNQALPEEGTIFRIVTTKPLEAGDEFTINTADFAPQRNVDSTAVASLDLVGIVPNPYKGTSAYETSVTTDVVRFTNLPDRATIRVYTLAGTLVRTMTMSTFNNEWDLKTDSGLDIASGMYLIHVDVPGVGEKVLKFGVVKKRIQLDLF